VEAAADYLNPHRNKCWVLTRFYFCIGDKPAPALCIIWQLLE
jgi:hypothetical protein